MSSSGPTASEEQYFPRGSTRPRASGPTGKSATKFDSETKRAQKHRQTEDLFRVLNASKKSKKSKKARSSGQGDAISSADGSKDLHNLDGDSLEDLVIEPLTHKTVQSGMVILGAVHHIYGSMVRVALPGVIAQLPIGNISSAYSALADQWSRLPPLKLQRRTLATAPLPDKLVALDELFRVGQLVKVAVQSTSSDGSPIVSTVPEDVNGSLPRDQLREGMVLQAAVSSVEDHGYALEVGISGLPSGGGAFLAAKYAPRVLNIGELLLVRVKQRGQSGRLQFIPYTFNETVPQNGEEWNLNTIMPGMIFDATIVQNNESGLGLWLLDSHMMGAVEPRQIPRETGVQLSLESHVSAVMLYKHPILNTVYCSLRVPPVDENDPFAGFHGVQLGQIIEKAVIVEVTSTFVKLEVPVKKKRQVSLVAVAIKEHVCDDDTKEPPDVFSPGQVTACRVIGLSLFERQLYVSLRVSVVEQGCYYTEDELVVGRTVPAKVKYTNDTGIVFEICPGVVAFCDYVEASFVASKKNAAELFPSGKPMQVCIRYINGKHYPKRYFVTCNRQLIKSKHEFIGSYDTTNVGKLADGVVLLVKPRGLLIGFYNKVRGWAPEEHLPHSHASADKTYQIGQVVTTKIVNVNPEANRMTLSLRIDLIHCGETDDEGTRTGPHSARSKKSHKTARLSGGRDRNRSDEDVELLSDSENCLE